MGWHSGFNSGTLACTLSCTSLVIFLNRFCGAATLLLDATATGVLAQDFEAGVISMHATIKPKASNT